MVRSLPDLVADGRNRLQVLRDGSAVRQRQVLVPRSGALDDFAHQAASHVTIGLITTPEEIRDLLHRPSEPGLPVWRDVRNLGVLGPLGIAGKKTGVVHRVTESPRRVALAAVPYRLDEVLAARDAGRRCGGRRRFARRERREPGGQEDAFE